MKIFLAVFLLASLAQARVFDMSDASFGGYFNATYGNSGVGTDYFKNESSATSYSGGFKTNLGGEFGFIYNTRQISWLFGLEILKPSKVRGDASTGGTTNYSYTGEVSVYTPKVGIELVFFQQKDYRIFANASVGTANLSVKNSYSGLNIAPNTNFSYEGKGTANLLNYSLGGEWHWTDNTTVVLAVGYRQLNFKKVSYLNDVASSFTGAHTKGQKITKADGSALEYDFTNSYLTLGLRFWMQ